jgi:hypothetical protein
MKFPGQLITGSIHTKFSPDNDQIIICWNWEESSIVRIHNPGIVTSTTLSGISTIVVHPLLHISYSSVIISHPVKFQLIWDLSQSGISKYGWSQKVTGIESSQLLMIV